MTQLAQTRDDWFTPGRWTVRGYLLVSRGGWKKRYNPFEQLIASAVEETTGKELPRRQDLHAVWFDRDEARESGHQLRRPFLRYRASRPIPGLRRECSGHRVELTCTIGEPWQNGLGAFITRAQGRCLDCELAGGASVEEVSADG